ncbi:hypothetical protein [Poseidonibacter sp.]|uniref:hypothetical protein n=1 Tax=Poseidonibacter sp. TaxID=2321188 RepID=UPI003C7132EF
MIIDTDHENKITFVKIENKNIDNPEDRLLLNILLSQGWTFENSTITLSQKYKDTDDLIFILKKLDVPEDGIEEILISSKIK